MKELWVKKTVYRRYLISDKDIAEAVQELLDGSFNDKYVAGWLDKSNGIEYYNEKTFIPVEFEVKEVKN